MAYYCPSGGVGVCVTWGVGVGVVGLGVPLVDGAGGVCGGVEVLAGGEYCVPGVGTGGRLL